jgi:hypothetical protein
VKPGQGAVYVLNAAGIPEERKIKVGISDGIYSEVVSAICRKGTRWF